MNSRLTAIRVLPVLFILLSLNATASDSPENGEPLRALTLQQAVTRALANNPGIRAAALDVDIQQARRDAGALSTPLRLSTEIENFGGTDNTSGFDSAESTLQLSKTVELGDKPQRRAELGDARVSLAQIEASARELALVALVSKRFTELLRLQGQLELMSESMTIRRRTLEIVQRRVEVGRTSEAEQSAARVALWSTELASRRLEFELAALRARLSSLWGSTAPDFNQVSGDLGSVPTPPDYAELAARLADNPELRKIATSSQVLDAQQSLAQSMRRPDIQLSAGVRHLAATEDTAVVVGLSMPFGSSGRAEPLVREAETAALQMPESRDDLLFNVQATLFNFHQMLLASHGEHDSLRDQIIPEAERAVEFYERGFELGSVSLLELTTSQERLLTLREQALDAAASFHLNLIEIQSLLGDTNPGGALQ